MASIFQTLIDLLRVLCSPRNYIKCFYVILALLGRGLRTLWRSWDRKTGAFRKYSPAGPPCPGTKAEVRSVLGGSGDLGRCQLGASSVPASASFPGLQERAASETREAGATTSTPAGGFSASPPATRAPSKQSRESFSSQRDSSHSDRLPDIIRSSSREPLRAAVGQPSRRSTAGRHPLDHEPVSPFSGMENVIHEEPLHRSSTTSPAMSEYFLPEGRFLQLIHSDQLPRYARRITV
jgi:hypothetical protein